jgi:hypothetical protein
MKDEPGDKFDKIVVTASYETTDPTVDTQTISLQAAAGANMLLVPTVAVPIASEAFIEVDCGKVKARLVFDFR